MDNQKGKKILEQIAKAEGVSVEEVRRNIQAVLAVSKPPLSSLTPEEAILYIAKRVKDRI